MPTVGMGRVPATLGRQFGKMRRPASLGAKLVLIMTGVALCGTVAITVLLASIITPSPSERPRWTIDWTIAALSRSRPKPSMKLRSIFRQSSANLRIL